MEGCFGFFTCQSRKERDSGAIEAMNILCPLEEEVYDEVLRAKYKRTKFSKFDGVENPGDHVTTFELKCESITTNNKHKLQQVPSSLIGSALRWFNNRPHYSIASWEDMVEKFAIHFQSIYQVGTHQALPKGVRREVGDL